MNSMARFQGPLSSEFQDYLKELKEKKKKQPDPLTRRKQSKITPAVKMSDVGFRYSRENEGRLNTDNEEDYNRWLGMTDMKNMARETARRRYKK